ncbi:MAG: hypothetical protein HIU83_16675 [Proteobacteria bacterium]|nr:hypothetical protein [Pseudomonadota bacterium]
MHADSQVSRIQDVKDTLARLKELSISYPSVSITSLDAVEDSIKAVERETQEMMTYVPKTASESIHRHNSRMGEIIADKDSVLDGVVYLATMQLRTPLWILQKDGEMWCKGEPPEVGEPWMGIWRPHVKTWKELGFKGRKELPESDCASDIGPVNHKKYLKFLIDIRTAVETNNDSKSKISSLKAVMRKKQYDDFIDRHGGKDKILQYFA